VLHLAVSSSPRRRWNTTSSQRRHQLSQEALDTPFVAMDRTEMAVMPPARRSGRSPVEPSHAKASKVRTLTQHDWTVAAPPNLARGHYRVQEHGWDDREVPRMKHGDAVQVGSVGVARRSSRAERPPRDLPSRSKKTQTSAALHPQDQRPVTYSTLAVQPAVSSYASRQPSAKGVNDKRRSTQGQRRLSSSSSTDQQLQALGAWSDTSLVRHKGMPVEFLGDTKRYHAVQRMPDTPRDSRLSTPDLDPLPEGHEFCACCVDVTAEELDEAWYQAGKSRMDAQRKTSTHSLSS
jgi:hypothetical protein